MLATPARYPSIDDLLTVLTPTSTLLSLHPSISSSKGPFVRCNIPTKLQSNGMSTVDARHSKPDRASIFRIISPVRLAKSALSMKEPATT